MQITKELRIGNLINYKIVDDLDKRKEWLEICEIDADDISYLSSLTIEDTDYKFIPINEEWFIKFGFKKTGNCYVKTFAGDMYSVTVNLECVGYIFSYHDGYVLLEYVHQLQNLFFCLTNEELKIDLKNETN